jgi:cation transport ATPase
MRLSHSTDTSRGEANTQVSPGFRVCLSISGLRCASEGAPLERALRRIEGVQDATVNPLRDRVSVVVDALTQIDAVIQVLAARGYPVDPGEICVTTWLSDPKRLRELKRELLAAPAVTFYTIAAATGRVELRLTMNPGWELALHAVCEQLCAAAARERTSGTPLAETEIRSQRSVASRAPSRARPRNK